ncbi:MAG: sirohydrochlorin cobaltochelatase [Clostridium sp.]
MNKKIILVTFGTRYIESYKRDIVPFLMDLENKYNGEYEIELCFTSRKIIDYIRNNDICIDAKLIEEIDMSKCKEGIIYPLYLTEGAEYEKVKKWSKKLVCDKIILHRPILRVSNKLLENKNEIISIINEFDMKDSGVIIVSHGSKEGYDLSYKLLRDEVDNSNVNVCFVTLNDKDNIKVYLDSLKCKGINKVIIVPFLIVLGYHFKSDIQGWIVDEVKNSGFESDVILESLGRNKVIRDMFLNREE